MSGPGSDPAQGLNGRVAECGPHLVHLLPGEWELLGECHRRRVYLAVCGAVLPVAKLASSWCEPGCEREITYCTKCLDRAAKHNAEAGLGLDSARDGCSERRERGAR